MNTTVMFILIDSKGKNHTRFQYSSFIQPESKQNLVSAGQTLTVFIL